MILEYLLPAIILGWALFYLWKTFFKKKGCSCGSCPSAGSNYSKCCIPPDHGQERRDN